MPWSLWSVDSLGHLTASNWVALSLSLPVSIKRYAGSGTIPYMGLWDTIQ